MATSSNSSHVSHETAPEILLSTAKLYVQASDGSQMVLRALIDQGSQTSLISENAAQRLGLPRKRCKGVIFGVGAKENNCKGVMSISCTSINSDDTFETDVYIMRNLINNLPNRTFKKPSWSYLESIELADPDFNISRPVDLLLGADIYSYIMLEGIIKTGKTQPIAQQTRLGWILCGSVQTALQCNVVINNMEDIQRFWNIEDIAVENSKWSEEDLQCIKYYQDTTKRSEDGKYVVNLPMKENFEENLGKSKPTALAQFRQLERKFLKQEKIAQKYKQFINEYKELNHMAECTSNSTPSCYLPHHCVLRPDSATTALRVVFNASSKTSTGYTLNDLMKCGPNLQQDLMALILRWRQYRFAFIADIEKMFRQIWVNPEHQKLSKIIWRDSLDQLLREYQLTTVTYGTKAAPFLAMMTLKQLSIDEGHNYPNSPASQVLQEDMYMDDLQSGAHSMEQAKKLQLDLINLLKSGGFNLRKWRSNSKDLENINEVPINQNQIINEAFEYKQPESTKTLGLRWLPESDQFTFNLQTDTTSASRWTKRSLLSEISKIYDPLGWLSPLTTKLKLLFKKVWLANLQRDDLLPDEISNEWLKIKIDLQFINEIKIPRWYQCQENDSIELHGFCDASTKAYASVVYSKTYDENQTPCITLVAAKARLAPENKNLTLPRLELSGAYLLSDLMKKVYQALAKHNITMYGWTDSTAVLGWIQGDANKWKPFVSNRVAHIQETMPPKCWHYVKSDENPADCASRGILAHQLQQHPLRWRGPEFLTTKYQEQKDQPVYSTNEELKNTKTNKQQSNVTTVTRHEYDVISSVINAHSSWARVTRVLAWVLRFITRHNSKQSYLTISELRQAKIKIIKHLQQAEFPKEIDDLKEGRNVDSKSKLLSLTPFLDKNGLLRVGGRIKNANISQDMIHPLIIPHNGHVTDLLIDHAHKLTFHGGARLTLACLRQQYWIIGGNRAVKRRLHTCVKCKKVSPIKQQQLMGDLPQARINATRPFYHAGVDFTGYVEVKASKGRGIKTSKGYVAVFVCMATKAVHLELVSDLSTSAFLAALRRMAARRGSPGHLYSDNGTNFVGASNILEKEFFDLSSIINEEFLSEISMMNIEWHFNAPSWPSAGGLWEAAVKSLKYHLKRVIGDQKLTFEEFSTLLAQLKACLNSRPLTSLTEDPEDLDYLTPAHFTAGGPILSIIETERDKRTRWQLTQKIFQDIWKRWRSDYLTQLASRSKWQKQKANVKIGDIVTVNDANLPAGRWALARVTELHPGSDGLVRVVTIKTKNGYIKRPITKLSPLPVKTESISDQTSSIDQQKDDSSETNQEKPKRSTRKPKVNFCTMVIMMMNLLISTVHGAYNISPLRNNQSIYFDDVSSMYLVRDDWKLVVFYDMEPYWQSTELFNNYMSHLDDICLRSNKAMQCDVVMLQLHHSYAELQYYNEILLNQEFGVHSRIRRGLINGIGYVANSLFGVLDEHFAEQYQKDIELIRANQKHITALWKNQTSVVEAEYNLLKRVATVMEKQHKIFNKHLNDLESAINVLNEDYQRALNMNEFSMSAMVANNLLLHLTTIQNYLVDTITDIYHGKFDIHLITPTQLREELSIISGQLSKDLSLPINNLHTDLAKIYHLLKIKARVTQNYLIFEIKIPLVNREKYQLYRMIPIPQQHGNEIINIIPVSDHLAINIQKDIYIPMSSIDIQNCMQYDSDSRLCELKSPIYHMKSDENLCKRDSETKECKYFKSACNNQWEQLSSTNTHLYFCCDQCVLRLICADQVTTERVSKAGIISLGRDCIIKGDTFSVYSHKHQQIEMHTKPDITQFEIPSINNLINLSIPLTKVESDFKDQKMQLKDIEQQIKQMKAESGQIDRISYHDVHHYAVIYLLVGAAAVCGASYAWWRLRRARRRSVRLAKDQQEQQAPEAPAPPPRGPLVDSVSASAQSVSAGQTNAEFCELRVFSDKSTSPTPRKNAFVINEL